MLSTKSNGGKYLSEKWASDRNRAIHDRSKFTAAEQSYLEVTGQSPGMGNRDDMDRTLVIKTKAIESGTPEKSFDVRKRQGA